MAQEGQVDPWGQAAPLDHLGLVDLETLQDPDLPTGDMNQLNQGSKQERETGGWVLPLVLVAR